MKCSYEGVVVLEWYDADVRLYENQSTGSKVIWRRGILS
jgi:hypothetical protein